MRVLKWLFIVLLLLLIVVAIRLLTYSQSDDDERVESKQAYLAQLSSLSESNGSRPNIVLILFDDLGFGDLGSYGAQAISTPHIDGLAAAGAQFNNYYAPAAVCTPSRAAMLTGRYAPRAGLPNVSFPAGSMMGRIFRLVGGNTRLPFEEILLPEVLKASGYRTGMVGKWHMGDFDRSLPNQMGFDYWYGSPYSNDMKPFSIFRNDELLVEHLEDQSELNRNYVNEAVQFIQQADDRPTFLYYAHNFPHIPLFSSAAQEGKSEAGLYGDVVEDLDNGVGEILAALKAKGQLENTLVILTSDNGPWYQGSPGPNRGRKGKTFDGGQNVPLITSWPEKVRPGVKRDAVLSGVDLFPSLLQLLELPLPDDRIIDGENRLIDFLAQDEELLNDESESEKTGHRLVYYFNGAKLEAVRDKGFKYQTIKPYNIGQAENVAIAKGPFLFNMQLDELESYDVSEKHPQKFTELQAAFNAKVAEMENNARGWLDN